MSGGNKGKGATYHGSRRDRRKKGKPSPDNKIHDLDFARHQKGMKKELAAAMDAEGMLDPPPELLADWRAHGAALAHEAIAWHGKARIMEALRQWKGRDEEAIACLTPAFEAPPGEPWSAPWFRQYYQQEAAENDGMGMTQEAAERHYKELWDAGSEKMAYAFQQEQARGLYEALTLLIPTEDERGREIHLGYPLDAIGALLDPDTGEQATP